VTKGWTKLHCRCGATWEWWGSFDEARVLRRFFENYHGGAGHKVTEAKPG
jgi:hypothetical protein